MNRRVRDPYARWCERRTPVGNRRSRLLDYVHILFAKFYYYYISICDTGILLNHAVFVL